MLKHYVKQPGNFFLFCLKVTQIDWQTIGPIFTVMRTIKEESALRVKRVFPVWVIGTSLPSVSVAVRNSLGAGLRSLVSEGLSCKYFLEVMSNIPDKRQEK